MTGREVCFNCHGKDGDGNGPLAAQLNLSPRNFRHHGFWPHRTEGEIFWVIKNGSPDTSMVGFGGQLTDIEITTRLVASTPAGQQEPDGFPPGSIVFRSLAGSDGCHAADFHCRLLHHVTHPFRPGMPQ